MPKQNKNKENLSDFRCLHCGQCCHFFEMIINPLTVTVNGLSIKDSFKKELQVEFTEMEQCSIKVQGTCNHFDKTTGLCKVYDDRPAICRNHFCQRYPKIDEENE